MFVNFEKPCFEQDLQRRIDNPASRKHSHDIASKKMLRYRFLNFCVILLKINPAIALFLPLPASQNLASILFRNVQRTFFRSNKFELTPASTLTIKAKNKIIYAY